MIIPVIPFNGDCEKAMELYERAFDVTGKHVDYYRNAPSDSGLPINDLTRNRVMHAGMTICGTYVNMHDTEDGTAPGSAITLNVMVSEDEVIKAYNVLREEGTVVVELGPQFFSPMYASVKDCYGVCWQLITNQ